MVAALIELAIMHKHTDDAVIFGVVLPNWITNFFQQGRAWQATEALKCLVVLYAGMMRNGRAVDRVASQLVPARAALALPGGVPAEPMVARRHSGGRRHATGGGPAQLQQRETETLLEVVETG